ncbi:MAG: phosphoribosylformylglycinamidine cyclo-ligase [Phycisphaerales bacterium]|nr:MAG: phosphoribosylformylglycinamidine cyclo-ligase [Phycisphaerales bacterium]
MPSPSTRSAAKRPRKSTPAAPNALTYAAAGVDIDQKDAFTESLDSMLKKTHTTRVIPNPGGFAGLFRLDFNAKLFARNYKDPVLVACCDGVGTKVLLARDLNIYNTVGIDLVAMNVNDLVVQGAEPLFFLDYIATPKLDNVFLHQLVEGIANACKACDTALLGGETAHMPDVYSKDDFDLAGFCVGVVDLKRAQNPTRVKPNDVILGLESDGIHSNGYTLVRKIIEKAQRESKLDLKMPEPTLDPTRPLGQVLLTPTRLYAPSITRLLRGYRVKNVISGMAHITGSGMAGNLCRALPKGLDALVDRSTWPRPALFSFLQDHGNVPEEEMWRVFNMGIGYCVIVRPAFAQSIMDKLEKLGERVHVIGKVVRAKSTSAEGAVRFV